MLMVEELVVRNCESGVRNCPRCGVSLMSWLDRRETHAYCMRVGRYILCFCFLPQLFS